MSSPFTAVHQALMLVAAGGAVLIGGASLIRAFHPRWRPSKFRYAPITGAVLLLLFAALLITVACATSFVVRHVIWLPLVAVVGLTIQYLAHEYDERPDSASMPATADAQPLGNAAIEPEKVTSGWAKARKSTYYLLWAVVFVGAILVVVELRQTYVSLAIGAAFFLLFAVPRKDRPTVAKLFGIIALWGVPAILLGIRVAQFLILSALYGVGPVWNHTIRVTRIPRNESFIQLSNGDEFRDIQVFFWRFAVFIIVGIFAALWLLLLIWLSKRLYPPIYVFSRQTWHDFRKGRNRVA